MRASSLLVGLVTAFAAAAAFAQVGQPPPAEENPAVHQPHDAASRIGDTPRMIVKFRSAGTTDRVQLQQSASGETATNSLVTKFASRAGLAIRDVRELMAGMNVLRIDPRPGESFEQQLERVRSDADVEFAVPDERRFPHAIPSDPLFTGQWYLQNAQPAAINAQTAWDTSVGSAGIVIAVIDTGILYGHPDLKRANIGGRVLPGYDFITQVAVANDGNGRDADPTDAGDWVTAAETGATNGPFTGCGASNSSWHGTRVSGIIGALSNNSLGVTGITWNPWILPARALGKCGGFDSDIIDAMAWAAGRHINGVPDNPYPAKIENLSLGSTESCPPSYASVVADLATSGVLVVASAGNEGGPVDAPANCPGVAGITGLRHAGTKVGFASLGPEVALGAPGGNCVNTGAGQPCLFSIDTTTNDGTTTAGNFTYTDQFNINVGTSFSSPIVSAIAGLMASVNGNLNSSQLLARLKEGATTPFPVSTDPTVPMCHVPANANDVQTAECSCTTSTCGAGMANAAGALNAALRPIAAVSRPADGSFGAGQAVALSGAGSAGACQRTIATYAWTITAGTGSLTSNNTAATSLNAAPSSGTVTVRLTVTDDAGKQDTADVVVASSTTTSTAPQSAGSNACPTAIAAPPPVTVTVAPATATVQADVGTQTFTATVTNTQNVTVTWDVNGVAGGNSTVGTVSASGVYSAPLSVPTPATVTVTATSTEDPTRKGSAQVTLTAPPTVGVTVTPTTASLPAGGATQQFSAAVTNTTNTGVTWSVNGMVGGDMTVGTIGASGIYTPPAAVPTPATVTVTATSIRDATRSASAQVTIAAAGSQPSTSTSSSGSGGGGGGGALDLLGLLVLVTLGRRFAPTWLRAQRAS